MIQKNISATLSILFSIIFLTGIVGAADILPTRGFYVNDYATVIIEEHRDVIQQISEDLFEQTGVRLVVLTVKSTGGQPVTEYGRDVMADWEIGGPEGDLGALILYSSGEREAAFLYGDSLIYLSTFSPSELTRESDNPSAVIRSFYLQIAKAVYERESVEPSEQARQLLEDGGTGQAKGPSKWVMLFFVGAMLIMMRSYSVSSKYRKRYLKGNIRQPRPHQRVADREESHMDSRDDIDY